MLDVEVAKKSSKKSKTTIILHKIRDDIMSGRLLPEQRLHISALEKKYFSGSSPIREALSRLVAEGLVEANPQKGFKVSKISLESFKDITSTKIEIEMMALRKAMELGDDDWEASVVAAFHKLSKLEKQCRDAKMDYALWEQRNREFHKAIISGCNSKTLLDIHDMLYKKTIRYRQVLLKVTDETPQESFSETNREHKAIMDAVLERDYELAKTLCKKHLHKTLSKIDDAVRSGKFPVNV